MLNQDYTTKLLNLEDVMIKISSMTAMRYFNCFNRKPKVLPEVVSIDEFKGNSGGEKYNCILVDPENRRVLDILPDRYENHLIQYFSIKNIFIYPNY